jgi:hypothetical protein
LPYLNKGRYDYKEQYEQFKLIVNIIGVVLGPSMFLRNNFDRQIKNLPVRFSGTFEVYNFLPIKFTGTYHGYDCSLTVFFKP